jgi:large subunit ribosomal protein L5
MARMKEMYQTELVPQLLKDLQLKNVMEVPKVEKVVINMGLGEAIQNIKVLESAVDELSRLTGQKAVITKAKKSIATFKLAKECRSVAW